MKFLALTLFFCISLQTFATPKQNTTNKIKFHKPETDAEKALDMILKVENGVEKNSKLKHEDMFTKEFDEDYERQDKKARESKECKDEGGGMDCYPWDINIISCSQDPPYGYSKHPYGEMFKWTNCHNEMKKCEIKMYGNYYMKKENKKWKIDGICCGYRCFNSVNIAK
jgi:hypothetical protein